MDIARELGLEGMRIACVEGDDVSDRVGPGTPLWEGMTIGEVGRAFIGAHAYLGAEALMEALAADAQVIITGRHCDVDPELRDVFQKRFDHLERYESRASRAEVTVTAVKRGFEAEALISIDRADRVHARAGAADMRSALDRVVEKLGKQLRRLHDRHHEHRADVAPLHELGRLAHRRVARQMDWLLIADHVGYDLA